MITEEDDLPAEADFVHKLLLLQGVLSDPDDRLFAVAAVPAPGGV